MKKIVPFGILVIVVILALMYPGATAAAKPATTYVGADIAWMLISTALVLLMTPGLAFFYGGMVRKKNVISTMLQSFVCMGLITIIWVVFGFSMAFGDDVGGLGLIGNPKSFFMMQNTLGVAWAASPTIPVILFAMFQLKFAVITPALITGAFAERIRFNSYLIFITLFIIVIYIPLAHATWHPQGYFFKMGVLDFAGGTVVHMSAGWAALASALYLKKRTGAEEIHTPARISYVILGTGLLWFGWFGFNAGSALSSSELAATALATTTTASAAAAMSWIFFDILRGKKPSAMGACIGAVVGLVAVTPAAGYITVSSSLIVGIVAAVISNLVVIWRSKTNIDDTLDVFPCHGVGGMVGMLMTGIFATKSVNGAGANGLAYGETSLFFKHVIALVAVSVFAFVGAFVLLKITDLISPLRVTAEEEIAGLDMSQHDEEL
ncbi:MULTISPECIES: ammonium transporter [unclassified Mucilaginibacter]|uniref:ammonium transporter n=1 Tax=unclassified Mucilaginibacter TaxID=2617802 RepID=UPI002AC96C0F|nr:MULTISPECIES: ammonium transporter [unclassified Mucilaginibacter]MEB0260855.1 ammonium transporter [Mucilaginibacter sp. 10I4]MEB0278445.1 ammonium transporter [Mucilaginibacter sp. 10B2]MEB0301860.1 ammonium transporter [Mucilaginibacter sp. 5C4]WPX24089.1 ammonium transporter [Mucilaginibacter sp. 5C4]